MSIVFSSFVKNPKKAHLDGEDRDEHILYVLRRSFITNLDWIAIGALCF